MFNWGEVQKLKEELQQEKETREGLEKFIELQAQEIKRLKNKVEELLIQKISVPIQNFESFLDGPYSIDVDNYNLLSAIKERNEFAQLILDTSPNFICVRSEAGNIELVNRTFAIKLFGKYPKDLNQRRAADFYSVKEEREEFLKFEKEVVNKGVEITTQENFTTGEGKTIILRTTRRPFVTADGKRHVLGISTDITAEVLAKKQLEEQEELYRLLSENSRDIISLYDKGFNRIYASPAVERILGYTSTELKSKSPMDLMHPDDRDGFMKQVYESVINKLQGVTLECRYLRKDGFYVWLEAAIEPIVDENGNLEKVQLLSRDITLRKKIQQELRYSEKKYKDLIYYSQSYIISHDLQGKFLSANPTTYKALRIKEDEVPEQRLHYFIQERYSGEINDYLERIKKIKFDEGVFKSLDIKKKTHYVMFKSFLVEEPGINPYVISNAQDVTDRTLALRELKKAKRLAERNVRLNEKYVASLSHEIRTPMQGIMGVTKLLSESALDETQHKYLKTIEKSAENLLVVINEILDFSKLKEGKVELEQIPFNVNEVIQTAYQMLELKAGEKGLFFEVSPIDINTNVVGDPYRLNQILINLMNNAIKFTETGGVTVSGKVIQENDENVTIEFSIKDTGIGIAEENIIKIFEEFSQASTDITRKFGGTGLGLNISKYLVKQQKGEIWVKSRLGQGTTFKFMIPFKKEAKVEQSVLEMNNLDFTSLRELKVLLAEDNDVNIMLIKTYMMRWGMKVDVVKNGKDAIKEAQQNQYDIILMDIQMPDMNGLEATEEIRKLKTENSDVPIIALTASTLPAEIEMFKTSGMNDYLAKPYTEEELFTKIAKQAAANPLEPGETMIKKEVNKVDSFNHIFNLKICNLDYLEDMADGDMEFVKEMISLFIKQGKEELEKIGLFIESEEAKGVRAGAHKMKSTVSMIGVDEMTENLRKMEELAANDWDRQEIQHLYHLIKINFDNAVNELQPILLKL